ncbi:MAG: hypothetical protein WDM79_09385 [Terricaulis sp.]
MALTADIANHVDAAPAADDLRPRAGAIFADYERYLRKAEALHAAGRLEAAAVYAAIAAHMGLRPHPGFFASPRLERLLTDIGRRTAEPTNYTRPTDPNRPIKRILHVCTTVATVGGLRNMLGHWIRSDSTRTHSLALTQQRGPVIAPLAEAFTSSGGSIHFLNRTMGSQIAWARQLARISRDYDAVVLHTYSQDPLPLIAFADGEKRPPVLLLNHGDHLFWLGSSVSDVVINLRDAAQDLSITRRGIAPPRNVMVPTIVAPSVRTRSRADAKRALNLDPDTLLLFSAARGMKYRSVDGVSFADTHVELLKKHPKAVLWVLGVGDPEDWREASAAVGGRIKPFAETPDTKAFFEAADIYVDSFPFVSSTSMMEAAGLGTPLVSRFYGAKEARIFAINHPGIDKPTMHGATEAEYIAHLDRLIRDPALRESAGETARTSVLHYHTPPSWLDFLETAYERAAALPPIDSSSVFGANEVEAFSYGDPDRGMYEVFGFDDSQAMLKAYPGMLPLGDRIALVRQLRRDGVIDSWGETLRQLLPEWLVRVLKDGR